MSNESNRALLERALLALAGGEFGPFQAIFADDVAWVIRGTTPWSRAYEGKAAVLRMLSAVASRVEGPYRMHPLRFVAEGDVVVVEGRGDNALRAGGRYDNEYCWICRFEDGKLREVIEYMDTALVERVFGARSAHEPSP